MKVPPPLAEAQRIAARFPPLLLEAERVAATVTAGVHGRRRVGIGDTFWQFRPFVAGDAVQRIDWRQSAKSQRTFVRDLEWEGAQTCFLWRDGSPSMAWRSSEAVPRKKERAELLLLALAALLLRGGEQVRLAGAELALSRSPAALARLAGALAATGPSALPPLHTLSRHARLVAFGDFLDPLEDIMAWLGGLGGEGIGGALVAVRDPAERDLPFSGRVRFLGLEGEPPYPVAEVETLRRTYQARLAAHDAALAAAARARRFLFLRHATDEPPETAVLALYLGLAA
jgi:uncharacterized protein (DUF58 family)